MQFVKELDQIETRTTVDIWVYLPTLNLRKKFIYFKEFSLNQNIVAFLHSMGLEVTGDVNLSYFLDGKINLQTEPEPLRLICQSSMLHLVNISAPKSEVISSDEFDSSIEPDSS